MSADAAIAKVGTWIDRLQSLPKVVDDAAPDAAVAVESAIRRSVAAGTSVMGEAWPPTKDGRRPLSGAASAVNVSVSGNQVTVTLGAPEIYHHLGRGVPRREIIPTGELPADTSETIKRAMVDRAIAHIEGGNG